MKLWNLVKIPIAGVVLGFASLVITLFCESLYELFFHHIFILISPFSKISLLVFYIVGGAVSWTLVTIILKALKIDNDK